MASVFPLAPLIEWCSPEVIGRKSIRCLFTCLFIEGERYAQILGKVQKNIDICLKVSY